MAQVDVVSLDDVVILGNYNGNPWSETFTFQSGATIAVGDVYVVASSDADPAIIALADETTCLRRSMVYNFI